MRPTVLGLSVLLVAGCATRPTIADIAPVPAADTTRLTTRLTVQPVAAAAPTALDPREIVLSDAEELVGTRYRYGGSTPERGFDCSGFVQWIFARQGIDLPRTARAMSKSGVRVAARRTVLAPGDLLFFAEKGGAVSHVAIYAGDGRIIHASSGQGEVRYDDLDSARGEWFRRHITGARRVLGRASMLKDRASMLDPRCFETTDAGRASLRCSEGEARNN